MRTALALALLFVPVAQATPPADAFCVILIEASPDFATLIVTVDEETSVEERAALWPSVDLDGDGTITLAEQEAWRWDQTRAWLSPHELGTKAVTMHQDAPYRTSQEQRPVYAATWRQVGHVFHHQEYRLPDRLTQPVELETQEVRRFGFDLTDGSPTHIILRGGRDLDANLSATPSYEDEPRPVIEYVVVRAPTGWRVERVEGHSYNGSFVLEPKTAEVDLPAFDTQKPYQITFFHPKRYEQQTDNGSPGIGWAALAVLLVALAARRR